MCIAESPEDFLATSGVLEFTAGDVRGCYRVQIVDDNFCDPELFFSNLELLSGAPVILVRPERAVVVIQDSDCGKH